MLPHSLAPALVGASTGAIFLYTFLMPQRPLSERKTPGTTCTW
jgi:hypothetical protein